MSNNIDDEPVDPRLKAMLDDLRPTPTRDPAKVARGKVNFLTEADAVLSGTRPVGIPLERPTSWQKKFEMFRLSLGQRAALTSALVVMAMLVVLFGGAGMTALAARSALPGDALYYVKTGLEDTRVNLTSSSARQVELQLLFAQRRLEEIEKLIAQGRYVDVEVATQEFDLHIQNALASLEDLAVVDPVQAAVLAAKITTDLTRYAQALSGMSANAPETVRPNLKKALQASEAGGMVNVNPNGEIEFVGFIEQINPDELVINGQTVRLVAQTELKTRLQVGMLVKVHARRESDGSMVAREIDLAQMAPGNDNFNLNGNDDANQNMNGNDNDNANEAINANDDDRSGSNTNANEDDDYSNSNDVGAGNSNDDQSDANDNANNNGDDDANSNDNHNDNENRNDNDGSDNNNRNDNDHKDNENKNENG